MSLQSALVDVAHTVHRGPVGPSVHGTTPMGDIYSPDFKCRVSAPNTQELRTDQIQFEQATRDVTVLTGLKYIDGSDLVLDKDWKLVIDTGPYAGEYELLGDPEPIRKKIDMIGYNVAARRYQGKND